MSAITSTTHEFCRPTATNPLVTWTHNAESFIAARLIAMIALIASLDAGLTFTLLNAGAMEEVNPIAAWIFHSSGTGALALFKLGTTLLGLTLLWHFRTHANARRGLNFSAAVMGWLSGKIPRSTQIRS